MVGAGTSMDSSCSGTAQIIAEWGRTYSSTFPIRERDRISGMGAADLTHPFSVPVGVNLIRGCYKWRRRGGAETIHDDDQPKSGMCR